MWLLAFPLPIPEHRAWEGKTSHGSSWLQHGCSCLCAGREVRQHVRQHVPQDCYQCASSGALCDKGELSRGTPRVGINTGTILAQLKAADETPRRRLGSPSGLPRTSEYQPLLRVWDRRLQSTMPWRRVPEDLACSSPARKGTILNPEASTGCCWTLTSPCQPAFSGPSGSTRGEEGNSLAPGGRSRRHEIGQRHLTGRLCAF